MRKAIDEATVHLSDIAPARLLRGAIHEDPPAKFSSRQVGAQISSSGPSSRLSRAYGPCPLLEQVCTLGEDWNSESDVAARRNLVVSALTNRIVSQEIKRAVAPTEPRRWREVGWICRGGEILAIQRCGHETRMRESLL